MKTYLGLYRSEGQEYTFICLSENGYNAHIESLRRFGIEVDRVFIDSDGTRGDILFSISEALDKGMKFSDAIPKLEELLRS